MTDQDRIDKLRKRSENRGKIIGKLRQENARLREGLKRLEWLKRDYEPLVWDYWCFACNGARKRGHKPDCWLAKLLEEK